MKSSKTSNIKSIHNDNNLISDPLKFSNIFNNHFVITGSKIENWIPTAPAGWPVVQEILENQEKSWNFIGPGKSWKNTTFLQFVLKILNIFQSINQRMKSNKTIRILKF